MWSNEPCRWTEEPLSHSRKDELEREWDNNYRELRKETERLHGILTDPHFNQRLPKVADDVRLCVKNIGRANQKLQKVTREFFAKPLEEVWQNDHAIATWCELRGEQRKSNMMLFDEALRILNEVAALWSLCGKPGADADDVKRRLDILKHSGILMRVLVAKKFDGQRTIVQVAEEAGNRDIASILVTEAEAEDSEMKT